MIQTYKGKVLTKIEGEFTGLVPGEHEITEVTPTLTWTGSKIPYDLYLQITAFFRAVYDKHNGEAQIRLAYHPLRKVWSVVVFPQVVGGASTKETKGAQWDSVLETAMKAGYILNGSWHSHCNFGAFQSGTDQSDEEKQNGLHVTLGDLKKPEISIHSRLTFRAMEFTTDLVDWIQSPLLRYEDVPAKVRKVWMTTLLTSLDTSNVKFPDKWMNMVSKEVYTVTPSVTRHYDWKPTNYPSTYGNSWEDPEIDFSEIENDIKALTISECNVFQEWLSDICLSHYDERDLRKDINLLLSHLFKKYKESKAIEAATETASTKPEGYYSGEGYND